MIGTSSDPSGDAPVDVDNMLIWITFLISLFLLGQLYRFGAATVRWLKRTISRSKKPPSATGQADRG